MESQYLEKVKFLIVEDNAFMRAVLFQALKALGAGEVRMASNGADGLKELQDYQADIAIVDWEMQPVNGIEFVKTVRRSDDRSQSLPAHHHVDRPFGKASHH